MNLPSHAAPIGTILAPDYFSPGTSIMHGKKVGGLWVIAYWAGQEFRYERKDLDFPWIRVS